VSQFTKSIEANESGNAVARTVVMRRDPSLGKLSQAANLVNTTNLSKAERRTKSPGNPNVVE